jgi:integrase/recombinase XerD
VCLFYVIRGLFKEFVFDYKLRKLSERTIKTYSNNMLRLFAYIRREVKVDDIEEITPRCIQSFIEYLTSQGLKETYVNSIIKSARAFFLYASNEEYISKNIMKKIRWQHEEITIIETFTNQEVYKMINYYTGSRFLDIRNRFLIVVLCFFLHIFSSLVTIYCYISNKIILLKNKAYHSILEVNHFYSTNITISYLLLSCKLSLRLIISSR